MKHIYVLVADAARARVFVAEAPRGPLREVADLVEPGARQPAREINADAPGRTYDSKGLGRHAMAERTDPKRVQAEAFARRIAEYLHDVHANEPSSGVVLVAAPELMGLLRKQLDQSLLNAVEREVSKNVTQLSVAEISERLGFGH